MVLALTVVMGVVLYGLAVLLGPVFDPGYFFPIQALALLVLCVVGAGLYFALAHFTGVQRLGALFRSFRKAKR